MPYVPPEVLKAMLAKTQQEISRLQQENQELRDALDWEMEDQLERELCQMADGLPVDQRKRFWLLSLDLH
jgi:hypothetical protein